MFFASNISSKAQVIIPKVDPCTSIHSYPSFTWTGVPTNPTSPNYIAIECGGCFYLLEWYYRQVAIIRLEVQITQVIKLGFSSTPCTPGCDLKDVRRWGYMAIWEEIFQDEDHHQEDYNLDEDTDKVLMTVQEAQCDLGPIVIDDIWKINKDHVKLGPLLLSNPFVSLIGNDYHFSIHWSAVPCGDICCRMNYQVEWNSTHKLTNVEWDEIYGYGYIEQEECPTPPSTCLNTCDNLRWNWNPEDGITFTPISKLIFDTENWLSKELKIKPNPNDGEFSFNLDNDYKGNIVIEILSIYGEIISIERNTKESQSQNFTINLKNVTNGTYILRVKQENEIINHKFIISK